MRSARWTCCSPPGYRVGRASPSPLGKVPVLSYGAALTPAFPILRQEQVDQERADVVELAEPIELEVGAIRASGGVARVGLAIPSGPCLASLGARALPHPSTGGGLPPFTAAGINTIRKYGAAVLLPSRVLAMR